MAFGPPNRARSPIGSPRNQKPIHKINEAIDRMYWTRCAPCVTLSSNVFTSLNWRTNEVANTRQAAEVLNEPEGTLRYWRCAGKGPAYIKLAGRVRYDEADVIRGLKQPDGPLPRGKAAGQTDGKTSHRRRNSDGELPGSYSGGSTVWIFRRAALRKTAALGSVTSKSVGVSKKTSSTDLSFRHKN